MIPAKPIESIDMMSLAPSSVERSTAKSICRQDSKFVFGKTFIDSEPTLLDESKLKARTATKTTRKMMQSQALVASSFMVLVIGGVLCAIQLVHCSLQQSAPNNNIQQPGEQPNALSQEAAAIGNGEYSALMDMARGSYSNNNKRARKMSAFMPMRGRKDGRDEYSDETIAPREADSTDASIMRLVSLSNGQGGAPEWWTRMHLVGGAPAPRQFANQFAAQHHFMTANQSPALTQSAHNFPQEDLSLMEPVNDDAVSMVESQAIGGSPNGMMQAKLRRAFQPMRGRRGFASTGLEQLAAELALMGEV